MWRETMTGAENVRGLAYIGKASGRPNIIARVKDHYHSYLGCAYDIPAYAGLDDKWQAILDRPAVVSTLFSEQRFVRLATAAFHYVNSFEFFVAPRDTDLDVIEHCLIWDLQPTDNTQGKKTPPAAPVSIVHHNAQWITPELKAQAKAQPVLA